MRLIEGFGLPFTGNRRLYFTQPDDQQLDTQCHGEGKEEHQGVFYRLGEKTFNGRKISLAYLYRH